MSSDLFTPQVVDAVMRHMNDDHVEDSLLIVRTLGGVPEATAARMSGMDAEAARFEATTDAGTTEVLVPWAMPVTERGQIRAEVVRMYHEACAALGIEPRAAAEH